MPASLLTNKTGENPSAPAGRFARRFAAAAALSAAVIAGGPAAVFAHCDGMDGPVVKAAQAALQTGDVDLALVWVLKGHETDIKDAFKRTMSVRKLGPEAKALADASFFETLVRIHREGEGAPFTGLKPAGRDLGPALPAADKALADGNVEPLVKLLTDEIHAGLRGKFRELLEKKGYKKDDVEAGRAFVRAYVEFIHYAERLHQAAVKPAHGHEEEGAAHPKHEE